MPVRGGMRHRDAYRGRDVPDHRLGAGTPSGGRVGVRSGHDQLVISKAGVTSPRGGCPRPWPADQWARESCAPSDCGSVIQVMLCLEYLEKHHCYSTCYGTSSVYQHYLYHITRKPMPARAEVLRDGTIGGEEPLRVPWRLGPPAANAGTFTVSVSCDAPSPDIPL
jgi:hypothetical protein